MKKVTTIQENVKFSENQRFRQKWLWLIMIITLTGTLILTFTKILIKNTADCIVYDMSTLVYVAIFFILLPFFFLVFELRTRVTDNAIYIRFFPFHASWICFPITDIASYSNVKYHPLLEYGGWGIRFGLQGKAYNVSGNRGIRLFFKNGKKLLIGSQDPDRFESAIKSAMEKKGNLN
jgi:hypothetical protein